MMASDYLQDAYYGVFKTGLAVDAYRLFKPAFEEVKKAEGLGDNEVEG